MQQSQWARLQSKFLAFETIWEILICGTSVFFFAALFLSLSHTLSPLFFFVSRQLQAARCASHCNGRCLVGAALHGQYKTSYSRLRVCVCVCVLGCTCCTTETVGKVIRGFTRFVSFFFFYFIAVSSYYYYYLLFLGYFCKGWWLYVSRWLLFFSYCWACWHDCCAARSNQKKNQFKWARICALPPL